MYRISHNDAIELEYLVRKLYNCDRAGVSGLADADNFESRPMDAAVMIISFIHAKGLQSSETQYDEFLSKYDRVFSYPDENDAAHEVPNYIAELTSIVDDTCNLL